MTNVTARLAVSTSDDVTISRRGISTPRFRCQTINAASGSKTTLMSLTWNARPNKTPARISAIGSFDRRRTSKRVNVATAGARAGISSMHEELNSTNPGDAISSPAVRVATRRPLTRRLMEKIEASRIAVNTEVTNRGPTIERDRCLSTCVTRKVCSGGWSFQTSV